ncbi:MAG: fumarylacetoacetate hydrolase family protein [Planctomycetota bacterium]
MSNSNLNLAKFLDSSQRVRIGIVEGDRLVPLVARGEIESLFDIIAADHPIGAAESLSKGAAISADENVNWLPPVDQQEVWAAGVTYKRSQTARMEESEAAASCYDRVYQAERPELFFKAPARRVSGHLQPLRIRKDATWNVPEPEVTLVLSPQMKIVGLSVGNDMSSRDIEGENPLYLPQAKCYDQSAGIGPWITLYDQIPNVTEIKIDLKIYREGDVVFDQSTCADQMARDFEDLVGWLARDNTFDQGAFLMTGTGIVPTTDFTLHKGDRIDISISSVGTLSNTVVQG